MHDVGLTTRVSYCDIHQVLSPIEDQLEVWASVIPIATEVSWLLVGDTTGMDGGHIEGVRCLVVPGSDLPALLCYADQRVKWV